jgi:hypothetical protein
MRMIGSSIPTVEAGVIIIIIISVSCKTVLSQCYGCRRGRRYDDDDDDDDDTSFNGGDVYPMWHFLYSQIFNYALVWGISTKHSPQRCGLQHVLGDQDVLQVCVRYYSYDVCLYVCCMLRVAVPSLCRGCAVAAPWLCRGCAVAVPWLCLAGFRATHPSFT